VSGQSPFDLNRLVALGWLSEVCAFLRDASRTGVLHNLLLPREFHYAEMLLHRGGAGDREEAVRLPEQSIATTSELLDGY
jgi:hypothetical protein